MVLWVTLGVAALAVVDVVRGLVVPGSLDLAWLALSAAVTPLLLVPAALLANPARRRRAVRWLYGIVGKPEPPGPLSAGSRRRALVVSLGATALLVLLASLYMMSTGTDVSGDEGKAVDAALQYHRLFSSGQMQESPSTPSEPRPSWVLAGLLSGGEASRALLAGRLISLLCGALLMFLVSWEAGRRAGPAGSVLGAVLLLVDPYLARFSSLFTDDVLVALLVASGAILALRSMDRPWRWPPVALLAGLAITVKSTALALLLAFPMALAWDGRIRPSRWGPALASLAAAMLPLLPLLWLILVQEQTTRDTELLGLLTLHGPEIGHALDAQSIPAFPGWGSLIVQQLGLMKVGDLITGAAMAFRPTQWWIAPLVLVPALIHPVEKERRLLASMLVCSLLVLGLVGWKGGDASRPFHLIGHLAALFTGIHARTFLGALRRRPLPIVAVLLVSQGTAIAAFLRHLVQMFRTLPGS